MAVLALCLPVMVFAQTAYTPCDGNPIVNGDFESGNTGFTSDYTFVSSPAPYPGGMYAPKTYAIGINPNAYHSSWVPPFGDHTTGTGNMMIVNATCLTGQGSGCTEDPGNINDKVWEQTVDVQPNRSYLFK